MRSGAMIIVVAACVCLLLGSGGSSAETGAAASGAAKVAPTPAAAPVVQAPYTGPGYGGRNGPVPAVRFLGVTTRTFPIGVGALAASQACNEEHPVSRLCEWADIFAALPPVSLPTEVLVAPNYVTNPIPSCLNPNGGLHCRSLAVRLPAACCGFQTPSVSPLASLTLSPSEALVTDCNDTFTFTALALDVNGAPLAGELVLFAIPPVVGGTSLFFGNFSPATGITDANGEVSSTLSLDVTMCDSNCLGGHDCTAKVQARNSAGNILSNEVLLVDQIP